jgi:hypothetical protein
LSLIQSFKIALFISLILFLQYYISKDGQGFLKQTTSLTDVLTSYEIKIFRSKIMLCKIILLGIFWGVEMTSWFGHCCKVELDKLMYNVYGGAFYFMYCACEFHNFCNFEYFFPFVQIKYWTFLCGLLGEIVDDFFLYVFTYIIQKVWTFFPKMKSLQCFTYFLVYQGFIGVTSKNGNLGSSV